MLVAHGRERPLLIFENMGFLDSLTKGANTVSAVSGAVGGVSSLLFGQSQQRKAARYQQKLQMELNAQQQQYARENAQTDYERQRALVRDNASLEKQGRQSAGLSTAGDFGSGSASVSPIAAPSAGSAPTMPDPNASMLAGVQTIQASANNLVNASAINADNRLKNSQSELNETDAITRAVKNISEIRAMRAKARSDEERAKYQMMENAVMEKFGMSNAQYENEYKASQALISASDAAIRKDWNEAQYKEKIASIEYILENTKVAKQTRKNLEQTLKNLRAEYNEILSRTDLNHASAEDTRAHADVNRETAKQIALENVVNGRPEVSVARYDALMSELVGKIRYGSYPDDKSKMALRIIDEYFDQPVSMRKKWLSDNASKFATYGIVCNVDKFGNLVSFGIKGLESILAK